MTTVDTLGNLPATDARRPAILTILPILRNLVAGMAKYLAYYLARTRATNDPHGLGAFLVLNEEYQGNPLA
jgi:hypothetical protein